MTKPFYPWAMLATNYDDVHINWPMYVQPKLNGVRAKWDVERKCLVSRQGKVIPEKVLPTLYFCLKNFTLEHSLDGELWSAELSFQELCGAVNGKRKTPHEKEITIRLHTFDAISEGRSPRMPDVWPWLPLLLCHSNDEFEQIKKQFNSPEYDGLILRVPGAPYIVGRTEALIKWKPWKYAFVPIVDCIEGKGKFKSMLCAFRVRGNDYFFVGGGSITEEQRIRCWRERDYLRQKGVLHIRYRELSKAGIPLQPQIVEV